MNIIGHGSPIATYDYQVSREEIVSVQLCTEDADEIISALDVMFGECNYNTRWTIDKIEKLLAERPPIIEDRKYTIASVIWESSFVSKDETMYPTMDGKNSEGTTHESVYSFLDVKNVTGYYRPDESYAVVSIVEIDEETAKKENLKPLPQSVKGSEIFSWLPEAKEILEENGDYLFVNKRKIEFR